MVKEKMIELLFVDRCLPSNCPARAFKLRLSCVTCTVRYFFECPAALRQNFGASVLPT